MKSAICKDCGNSSDILQIKDIATPEPTAGEVRIKAILSPIHNHDLVTIKGEYGNKPDLPATGGS